MRETLPKGKFLGSVAGSRLSASGCCCDSPSDLSRRDIPLHQEIWIMSLRAAVTFVLLLCVFVATAAGQTALGTITGIVADPAGAVVPNATIEARKADSGQI